MTTSSLRGLPARRRGFSLPEVALAIVVAGIAVVAVAGLLPVLLNAERSNGINTVISSLVTQAMGELRSRPATAAPPERLLFSENGTLVKEAAQARYQCTVLLKPLPAPTEATRATLPLPDPGTYCRLVIMEFSWPVGAVPTELNRRVIHATLAPTQ